MNIFVTGLTSSRLGGMEFHNLGNFIIVEPLFIELRKAFPNARISTGIQMSDTFYTRHNLVPMKQQRFWSYGLKTRLQTATDIVRLLLWKIFRINWFLNSSMLKEISEADLVIDFSGDIYGDNAYWSMFLESNARLAFALVLKKKVAMIIGSPGPFSSFWRQYIAKLILPKLTLITNREPLSTKMLAYIGIKGNQIYSTACPSVLFESASLTEMPQNSDFEVLFTNQKPTIGIILCGWNMPVGPFNQWPREDWEFEVLIKLISYLRENTNYRICLMSHQNATDYNGELIKGNDHRLIDRLIELLGHQFDGDNVFTLNGFYTAAQSKIIIGTFDLLISGRIHGAVQGLSQGIPTAIIDYGHEPKAHKLVGFARVYGIDDYVIDPSDSQAMISTVKSLIAHQETLRNHLVNRLSFVKNSAEKNFLLLQEITNHLSENVE